MPLNNKLNQRLLPIALVLLAAALLVAYRLFSLTGSQQLWGYLPFFLYCFAWSALVLLIAYSKQRKGKIIPWRRIGLASLSGLILALAFPGFIPFPWLLFIGFVPLLILHQEVEAARAKGEKISLFPYAYHTFFIWNALATFWVTNTALAAGLFAIIVNSALMCIPVLLFQRTYRIAPRFGYAGFVTYWITFESLHMQWDLSWPWLTLGNAFAQVHPTVQWYEFTGTFGGSLWILVMNLLLFQLWQDRKAGKAIPQKRLMQIGALIVLPIMFSLGRYYTYQPSTETSDVLVVQTNFEPHYEKFDGASEKEQIAEILALIKSEIDKDIDYIIMPETVFGYVRRDRMNVYPAVVQLRALLAAYPDVNLITGISAYHFLGPDEPHSRATKEVRRTSGEVYYQETYNAAIQLTAEEEEVQFYKKSKLVPGAESFPFPWLFFFMKPVVENLGGTMSGFGSQKDRTPFISPKGRIAPVICYESIYGEYFAGYVRPRSQGRPGAQAACIMTNDGWWDNTPGHRQHLYFASLRAIETRRSIARAANVGVSGFINEKGDRDIPVKYDEAVAIKGTISLNDEITFYVQWGDMVARIALYVSLLLLVAMIAQLLKARVKSSV